MNCPYCQAPMEPGFIQCRDGLYWTAKERPVAALPLLGGDRVDLSEGGGGIFSGHKAKAFCCRACKKVLVDYAD